jgi:hypothetical protein
MKHTPPQRPLPCPAGITHWPPRGQSLDVVQLICEVPGHALEGVHVVAADTTRTSWHVKP